jgi:hypothetical protein
MKVLVCQVDTFYAIQGLGTSSWVLKTETPSGAGALLGA